MGHDHHHHHSDPHHPHDDHHDHDHGGSGYVAPQARMGRGGAAYPHGMPIELERGLALPRTILRAEIGLINTNPQRLRYVVQSQLYSRPSAARK
jgi:hypothetical protein